MSMRRRRRQMINRTKALALIAPLALSLAPAGAWAEGDSPHAIDWKVKLGLTETIEAETNADLNDDTDGAIFGSVSILGLDIQARTKRALLNLRAAVRGAVYGGGDGADGRDRLDPDLHARYRYDGKDYTVSGSASFDVAPVSVAQFEDTGVTDRDAVQLTGAYGLSVAYRADARNSVSVGTTGRILDFAKNDTDTLFPSRTFGVNGSWGHAATKTTSVSLSGSASYYESDNDIDSKSHSVAVSAGLSHRRTPRHTLSASAGLTGVFSDDDDRGSRTDLSFNGGASLGYQGGSWTGSLGVAQSVAGSAGGEQRLVSSLRGALGYKVNSRNSVALSASAVRTSAVGGGDTVNFLSIGPTLSYRLTEDTSLRFGYGFRLRDAEDTENSHRVFLTLSTGFTPLD